MSKSNKPLSVGIGPWTGAVLGRSGGSAQNPNPPALTWNSLSTDSTPDFLVDLPNGWGDYRDAAAGDHLIVEYQLQAGGAWATYVDRTLSGGDISTDTISVTGISSVANGDYYFRGRITRGVLTSSNSSNVAVTIVAATSNNFIWSTGNRLIWSTGNGLIWS